MTDHARMNELAKQALKHIKRGDFRVGPDWEAAHEICQAHEGVQVHDRIHALCHRIEGDHGNAAYWDRRGNQPTPTGGLEDEWQALNEDL
ncbi:hypothetical protein ACFE33_02905 [Falsihalocynthiibacter sp. SS001]|uniref:hypothetical protein n=1 Tax=Falsihalocynthiibacter sp. SS001 TaxID=3349698 RepID=UPI0036D2118F